MTISLEQADSVVAAARRAAADRGETVTIAVVDADGDPIAFARMPGAPLRAIDSAQRKAAAAIALGFDTIQMAPLNDPGHLLPGAVSSGDPVVPHGGGVLIRTGGLVIGALGVSGAATPIIDHKIASAAALSG
ncbi:GlcG/HbpS family heme-binding protein [Nocardia asiatica]|uniref:GlcG/HbpS family heme-binding protein n=1 Tax=Nocardia asiatica TaxID=209252 RepID=UPI002455DA71|nr:heme-binding protein [Nocardia asiatica]